MLKIFDICLILRNHWNFKGVFLRNQESKNMVKISNERSIYLLSKRMHYNIIYIRLNYEKISFFGHKLYIFPLQSEKLHLYTNTYGVRTIQDRQIRQIQYEKSFLLLSCDISCNRTLTSVTLEENYFPKVQIVCCKT